jgi:hypothetical protein
MNRFISIIPTNFLNSQPPKNLINYHREFLIDREIRFEDVQIDRADLPVSFQAIDLREMQLN